MKKLFENWRKLLREGRWLFPKSKSDGPPPDPDPVGWTDNAAAAEKVRKAKRAAAAARAAEKYGPKTDDAETEDPSPEEEPKKPTRSWKMNRRINIKNSRRGDGLGATKPAPTTEGAESPAFGPEIDHIAAWMLGGIRNRSQVEDELVKFNIDRTAKDRDRGYSEEELTDIWVAASKMMMDL